MNVSDGSDSYYHAREKKHILRLFLMYVAPLILLSIYFQFHYSSLISDTQLHHLRSIAKCEAKMLDLYLRERIINLTNLMDAPGFQIHPSREKLAGELSKLRIDEQSYSYSLLTSADSPPFILPHAGGMYHPEVSGRNICEKKNSFFLF